MKINNHKAPYFSVVIPTKNRSFFLKKTIDSVLSQSFSSFELIIVDNDDTNLTELLIKNYDDSRLVYLRTGGLSMGDNWQKGLESAAGEYIIFNADKTLLMKDGLNMLHEYTIQYTDISIFNYGYHAYYDDDELYIERKFSDTPKIIESNFLINCILDSKFSDFISLTGRGYNSCIRRELLIRINNSIGKICEFHNPDYSIEYNTMLDGQSSLYIPYSPLLARQKSIKEGGYGNGSSYFFKTNQFATYLNDYKSKGIKYDDFVPIKHYMVYSVLMNDFLKIANRWGYSFKINIVNYYLVNIRETFSRWSYNVDIKEELYSILNALKKEKFYTKFKVTVRCIPVFFKIIFYKPYRFIEKNNSINSFINMLRKNNWKKNAIKYTSIEHCIEANSCPLP